MADKTGLTPREQPYGSGDREGAWIYFCSGHMPSRNPCYFCGKDESSRHLLVEEDMSATYELNSRDGSRRVSCCTACTEWWYNALSLTMLTEADVD